jgi:two-component system chemotaxis response regulator CheB
MTGMGKDGANNIGKILEKGGITIAQDQETSIVFGMPRSAIELRNIQIVSPLKNFPDIIMKIIKKKYKE